MQKYDSMQKKRNLLSHSKCILVFDLIMLLSSDTIRVSHLMSSAVGSLGMGEFNWVPLQTLAFN